MILINFSILLPPVTKKNSQRIVMLPIRRGSTQKVPRILPSKAFEDYQKQSRKYMPVCEPISKPVNVRAIYYMPTRRRVDLVNLHEALCDVLVHYGVLCDDNAQIIVSMDGSRVLYDKENPRTEVTICQMDSSN